MRAGARLFLLLLSCLLLLATTPDAEQPLSGYSAASSRAQREWEAKFRAVPDPQNQRDYMQRLSARPHHFRRVVPNPKGPGRRAGGANQVHRQAARAGAGH